MYVGLVDKNQFILTAGSDMRIRYWDLHYAANSHIVVNAATDPLHGSPTVSYRWAYTLINKSVGQNYLSTNNTVYRCLLCTFYDTQVIPLVQDGPEKMAQYKEH